MNHPREAAESAMRGSSWSAMKLGAFSVLVLGVVGSASSAQTPKPSTDRTFEETTQVIEVRVPVNVIGKDGEPVRGLTADSFTVLDNGEPQSIVDFQVVDLEIVEPDQTLTEMERAVPPAARRHFLLVFDVSFSLPDAVLRAREAARRFVLEELHPTDLVAVAMHSVEGGARILVTFTPDRAQVARAIDTLGAPRLLQLARRDPLRFMIDDLGLNEFSASQGLPVGGGGELDSLRDSAISQHLQAIATEITKTEKSYDRGRIATWSHSMADLARLLDTVQGRKHVVYFTEGFDGRLILGRTPSAEDPEFQRDLLELQTGQYWAVDTDDFYGNSGLQSDMRQMIDQFRRSDCVVQMVDISGLTTSVADITNPGADSTQSKRRQDATRAALFYIANDTGGELFEDANDFGPQLSQILERSSVTYVLTVRPNAVVPDGSFHRLKVKADLPGSARVSHRMGYYAPRPFEELHPLEKSLLASDAIAAAVERREIHMSVLAAPFRASEVLAYVPVIIEIDGDSLLEGQEDDRLTVELYTYATNQFGEMQGFFTQIVSIDLSRGREQFESSGLKYYGHLNLSQGDYLLRVLVRNAITGRTGVEVVPVGVPSYAEARPFLLPPFFVQTRNDWFLVREATGNDGAKTVVYPFTVNGEPYIPSALPVLEDRQAVRVCLVAYNLGDSEVRVDGSIVAEDGTVVDEADFLLEERTITGIRGLDRFLATFRPQGLEAGRYTLRVALRSPDSGVLQTTSMPFALGVAN